MSITVDQWTDLQPASVRAPLLAEMHSASAEALTDTDPMRRAFNTGLFTGYAVGFGLITREALDTARLTPGSSAVHIDFRQPRWNDDPDTLWACGVRHGYALATSEHPHADVCALCGERIIPDLDNYEQCIDGRYCENGECFHDWHANGPSLCRMEGDL